MATLRLSERDEIWWPVTMEQPRSDGSGRSDKLRFEVRFWPIYADAVGQLEPPDGMTEDERIRYRLERLAERVLDWRGDDVEIECTPETVYAALTRPWFQDGIMRALAEISKGGRAKN